MPCLDEARTLPACIDEARRALEAARVEGEILIADNGSRDQSRAIAEKLGARIVTVRDRGYGFACRAALAASRGVFVILGDSDDSYDFGEMGPFLDSLRAGADLVMGSRFRGRIHPGAMPLSHRYLGNPVLTGILNLLFSAGVSDAHCGLRALRREAFVDMNWSSGGMEFASELVIRAARAKLRIEEVPCSLHPDGRDRRPHLRSVRDGLRHLSLMARLFVS
jgi:glycosyltransferase involved in cell wall biosynthesis